MASTLLDVIIDNKFEIVELNYFDQPASVSVIFSDGKKFAGTGADIFSSFLNLREKLPGYIFQC